MTAAVALPRSTVLTEAGRETAKPLTEAEARELTADIRADVQELLPKIRTAYQRRADLALGYASWDAYCDAELAGLRMSVADRPEAVAGLRQAGMSQRAIGSALGISPATVNRTLATVSSETVPDRITGTDGREQPAARPAPKPEPDLTPDVLRALTTAGAVGMTAWQVAFLLDSANPAAERVTEVLHRLAVAGQVTVVGTADGGNLWALTELVDAATPPTRAPEPVEAPAERMAAVAEVAPELVRPAPTRPVTPPPGSPAAWTDEEREANRREIERKHAIEAAERFAKVLVLEISGMVTTIIDGLDNGAPGILVSLEDIDECRAALDRLKARVMA